jgi:hypothetical protein
LDLEGTEVARGSGWTEVPADSVVRIGRATAVLPAPGYATLRLSLFVGSPEAGAEQATNSYEFEVRGGPRLCRGT